MRMLVANLRKLTRRPATFVTWLLLAGLLILLFVAAGASAGRATSQEDRQATELLLRFPDAYSFILSFVLGLGGLLTVTYGAAVAGSEWTWGTLKAAVARGESRTGYSLAGFLGVTLFSWLGIGFSFLVGIVAAVIGATLAGVPLDGIGDATALGRLPAQFLAGAFTIGMYAAIGFTIATIAKSQLAGIGVGIGLFFGEQFAGIFIRDIVKWLPFDAANALIGNAVAETAQGASDSPIAHDLPTSIVLVGAWLLGSLVLASLWTERAEIAG